MLRNRAIDWLAVALTVVAYAAAGAAIALLIAGCDRFLWRAAALGTAAMLAGAGGQALASIREYRDIEPW